MNKKTFFDSITASTTFSSTDIYGETAKEIKEEIFKESSEETKRKNKEASELLHRLRSS